MTALKTRCEEMIMKIETQIEQDYVDVSIFDMTVLKD